MFGTLSLHASARHFLRCKRDQESSCQPEQITCVPCSPSGAVPVEKDVALDCCKIRKCDIYNVIGVIKCLHMATKLQLPGELLQVIGKRVRTQRLAQGLPMRELAAMAGLSLGALRHLETDGHCSLETLVRTVQALGLAGELDDLFVLQRQSIAKMERAEAAQQRQRAPRRSKS